MDFLNVGLIKKEPVLLRQKAPDNTAAELKK